MRFYVIGPGQQPMPANPARPYVTLRHDNWDDYGWKTTFEATLVAPEITLALGNVKILSVRQMEGSTQIESRFVALSSDYCSIGQDPEYYEFLSAENVPPRLRSDYLIGIRDAAFDPMIELEFSSRSGWHTSLLRFGQAENAFQVGKTLLRGGLTTKTEGVLSFFFDWSRGTSQLEIPFQFDNSGHLPGRCNALIGYNGVGKTTLLADLAVAASRVGLTRTSGSVGALRGDDTSFGSVIAVSYSAFDTFATPTTDDSAFSTSSTERFGYVYCGLRRIVRGDQSSAHTLVEVPDNERFVELKGIDEIEVEFVEALRAAGKRREREYLLTALAELSKEPSFGRAGVNLENLAETSASAQLIKDFGLLSTGHKIVLNIVTQLSAHLRRRSLVLLDEPETHLHPPLMAALLRAVQGLLSDYDSYAIVATHSPVVIQEIPGKYIKILERVDDATRIREPSIETFGDSIGSITRHVFSLDSSATDFQSVLAELAREMELEDIENLFANGLAPQARAFILNFKKGRL